MANIKIGKIEVQDSTGSWVVKAPQGYLLRTVDSWGKRSPEFTDHADTAIGLTHDQAYDQACFLGWAPHKISGVQCVNRKTVRA